MNKLKKCAVLVMAFLMSSCPVLSVSAAETTGGGGELTYHYFLNVSAKSYNSLGKYCTYELSAEVEAVSLLAAYWNPDSIHYGYDSYTICSLVGDEAYQVSSVNALKVTSYEVTENTGVSGAESSFHVGQSIASFIIGSWATGNHTNTSIVTTNIPYFVDMESAVNYLKTGDLTGNKNPYDLMDDLEEDPTYALTGFSASSEGKEGNIEAKWTGTTHDDKSADYESMEYHVSATYTTGEGDTGHGGGGGSRDEEDNQESITGGKQTESDIFSGDISEKGFKKLYSFFKPPSGTYHLYSLKILPTYTVSIGNSDKFITGQIVKGKPCYIYFDSDGNITSVNNEIHETTPEVFDDPTFELSNVTISTGPTAMLTGKLWHKISWSGTTKDNILKDISPDKTYISVFFYGGLENGSMKLYDYEDVYTYRDALRIFDKVGNSGNSFEFATQQAIDVCESEGRTFMGEVWLTPYYAIDNCIYKGKVTVVDVLNGKVGSIDPDDPEASDKPVYPDDPDKPDDSDSPVINVPSIDSILDVIPFFLSMLKSFISGVGQVPSLFAYLFPFLPSEIVYILAFGFVAAFVLRVLGR